MSGHHDTQFPKLPLYTGAGLIVCSLLLVAFVRLTGVGEVRTPQTDIVSERMLRFQDEADGGIRVVDAERNVLVEEVSPGTNGFLRGTLRGLARERKREGIGGEAPFRLSGRSDGRLLLEDPSTHRLVDLGAFGPTNAAVFVRLLTERHDVAAVSGADVSGSNRAATTPLVDAHAAIAARNP